LVFAMAGWSQESGKARADKAVLDGKYAEADALAHQMLAEADASQGAESLATAEALELIAECAYVLGKTNPSEGIEAGRRSVAIREKLLGPDSLLLARSLHWLSALLQQTGEIEAARLLVEREVFIREKAGPKENLAGTLSNLAGIYIDLGDASSAIPIFDRALKILADAVPGETRTKANLWGNQALAYRMKGDLQAAKMASERSLEMYQHLLGPDHLLLTFPLVTLGSVLVAMSDPSGAVPHLERAGRILERNPGPPYFLTGSQLETLGEAKAMTGDSEVALSLLERAMASHRSMHGEYSPNLMLGLPNLAIQLARTGHLERAMDTALKSAEIGRHYVDNAIPTLTERQAVLNAADSSRGVQTALSLLAAHPTISPGAVFDAVIRGRSRVFDEMARRRRSLSGLDDPGVLALAGEMKSARTALARVTMQGGEEGAYAQASDRKQRAERALAARSVSFGRELAGRATGLTEISRGLGADSALVSFVRFDRACLDPKDKCRPFAPSHSRSYLAFVLRGGGHAPTAVPLGDANAIDAIVDGLRQQISAEASAPGLSPKRSEAAYRAAALGVRQRIWDPLVLAIGSVKRIFVVPDGALHLVNWEALPVGASEYLVEGAATIHYLSAERDMVMEGSTRGEGLLAIGDPAFSARVPQLVSSARYRGSPAACVGFRSLKFEPLPATALELLAVSSIWNKSIGGEAKILRGNAATEEAFKREVAGRRVLHVASHGFFLGDCPSAGDRAENPLVLSGLALAGANQRQFAGAESEDGVLTAEEIAAMDLEGVEWAVLSACETGVGQIQDSEGVFGLQRAFQIAGARTVIMSLWPVDDQVSRHWMTALYQQRFSRGKGTAESVREASLTLLRERRVHGLSAHPWYWSGFVASGDWR